MAGDGVSTPVVVLVVDDDVMIRTLMRASLEQAGFTVMEAADGGEAMAAFASASPEIILLDVEMPAMNGFEVCRHVRASATGRHIPILMVTGLDDTESVNRAYEAGATDFVTKPINWANLAYRVRYMLRSARLFNDLNESRQREARLGRIINASSNELLVFHAETLRFVEANAGVQRNLGYDMGELSELTPLDLNPELTPAEFESLLAPLRDGTQNEVTLETQQRRKDGSSYAVHVCLQLCRTEQPQVFFAVIQDITERKRADERIRYLAFYDSLTNLPNRRLFEEHLSRDLKLAQRRGKHLTILFLDLDRFKHINDTLGHRVGDSLLKGVAERLKTCVRASDSVARAGLSTGASLVSRFGGDEFIILLTEQADGAGAAVVAQRIIDALAEPITVDGYEFIIGASIGIAIYPQHGDDTETLIRNADAAMYLAKAEGRNNYQFYAKEMNASSLLRFTLENDLRKALERGELMLHYQPQVNLRSGLVVGVEALIRWQHPERGMISPEEFVPLAEETGLILPIGEWVIRTACAQQRAWHAEGYRGMRVAVNMSFKQLRHNTLRNVILGALQSSDADPSLFELELTETSIMQNADESIRLLNELKALGIRLAVDDFGTGYSSLSHLKRFPLDTLKIDRGFVRDVDIDKDGCAIVAAIIAMAKSLDLKVIAEGVETTQQLAFLRQHDCDEMQGYLYSKPVPAEEVTRLFNDAHRPAALVTRLR